MADGKVARKQSHVSENTLYRKHVLQCKQGAAQCNMKFGDIMEDRIAGRQITHNHLYFFIQTHGVAGVKLVYTKDHLGRLCSAYGIRVKTTHNQQQLSQLGRCGAFP